MSNTIQVKFVYLQLVDNVPLSVEKQIRIQANTYLHNQWDDIVKKLELKKQTQEVSLNFLYPVKSTDHGVLNSIRFIPVEGDVIIFMNPVGAKNINKKKKKRYMSF